MTVVARGEASPRILRHTLRWARRALFCTGLSLLAYCTFVLVDARNFQAEENSNLDYLVSEAKNQSAPHPAGPVAENRLPLRVVAQRMSAQSLVGRIGIPRLGLSEAVVEGSDMKTLRRAVGHVSGTPLPGQPGNAVITAHRDRHFRPLQRIRQDDLIRFTSPSSTYLYRVVSIGVVNPGDVELLESSAGDVLTLVTCYPFYFVGPASHRFVVRAERVTNQS